MNPFLPSLSDFAEPWHADAACREHHNPDLWHPAPTDHDAAWLAKRICSTCPVREACLQAALDREGDLSGSARQGIWGGLNGHERARRAKATSAASASLVGKCSRGHDRAKYGVTKARADGWRQVRCLACQQELQDLHREAARILGLTQKEYRAAHGSKRSTAEAIIAQHERTTP